MADMDSKLQVGSAVTAWLDDGSCHMFMNVTSLRWEFCEGTGLYRMTVETDFHTREEEFHWPWDNKVGVIEFPERVSLEGVTRYIDIPDPSGEIVDEWHMQLPRSPA